MKDADGREIRVGDTLRSSLTSHTAKAVEWSVDDSLPCVQTSGDPGCVGKMINLTGKVARTFWRVVEPTPDPEPVEPAVLGYDENSEPVRVGDFLAAGEEDPGVIRVKAIECDVHCVLHAGFGDLDGRRDVDPLATSLDMGWTRARARELGYPAQEPVPEPWADEQVSARAGESADREAAVGAPLSPGSSPAPVPDCAACFTCGADVPIAALTTDLYDGKTKCVYCTHRIEMSRGPHEKWLGPSPEPEPYEEHGAWESCCWDGDG